MQASIYRRNYYLLRSNSNENTLKDQNKQREIYTETARVINQMISHTKILLAKINTVREELQAADISNYENMDYLSILQGFKEFQKSVPLTFFSQYHLDNKQKSNYCRMVGPFVLRLTKEIGYWIKNIPFLTVILQQIDQIFKEQKKNQTENISMIYFMTVKKIMSDSHQFFRKIKRKEEQDSTNEEEKERQPTIFLVPAFRLSLNRENQTKIKNEMLEKMKEKINGIYRCLDIVSFDVIQNYIVDIGPQENIELFSKKQLKRNKKMKKYVRQYKLDYKGYLERKAKNQERMMLKKRKLSFSKASFSLKTSILKNAASNKSLSNKNGKISFPSIKHKEKDVDSSSNKLKKKQKYKENVLLKEGQCNKQKILLATSKFKLGRGEIRLKL